jgi:hypothetical protein
VARLAVAVPGRHQHGGDGGLGLAVAVGGAVEELGGSHLLRNQAEKTKFDITGPQDGAGFGVLESGRGVKERVLDGQDGPGAALQLLMRGTADPLGTDGPVCACHRVYFYLKKGLRIQSAARVAATRRTRR